MSSKTGEKRVDQRSRMRLPLVYERGGRSFWSITEDLSAGGAFLQSFHPPETGEHLAVRLWPLRSEGEMIFRGRVVHRRERNKSALPDEDPAGPAGVGVVFEGVSPAARDRLAELLQAAEPVLENPEGRNALPPVEDLEDCRTLRDQEAIQRIFRCLCRKILSVHLRRLGGAISYAAYFRGLVPEQDSYRILAEPVPLQDADRVFPERVPFVFHFCFRKRSYSFVLREIPARLTGEWTFPLPSELSYREDRREDRYAHELKHPLTVEFPDPLDPTLHRVKNVLDVSFGGLAFKSYPGEEIYTPGTLLEGFSVYAADRFCRMTDAVVKYSEITCVPTGEFFQRVGVAFSDGGFPRLTAPPSLKEDEMEEMTRLETILQHLRRVSQSGTKILSGQEHCILFSDGMLRAEKRNGGMDLRVLSPHLAQSLTGLFHEGDVTYHYLLHGTYYFFVAQTRRENGTLRLDLPRKIYKAKRRRVLRVPCDGDQQARFHFLHPILGQRFTFPIRDLSIRGLAFDGDYMRHLLWKGFLLRECDVELGHQVYPVGSVEVRSLTVRPDDNGGQEKSCGVEFFDLPLQTERRLSEYTFKNNNPHVVQLAVEKIENLWQLFTKSGFLYPSKEAYLKRIKSEVNETWKTLLSGEINFFRQIVFREEDEELGTASAVQAYENSWLFQHLATTGHPVKLIPKYVILGLAHFLMEHREIKYLITYFRKENSFPRKIYSGFLEAYPVEEQLRFTKYNFLSLDLGGKASDQPEIEFPIRLRSKGIVIEPAQEPDREIIENCFRKVLDPLLIRSRSLHGDVLELPETSAIYRANGLVRERFCLVAREGGDPAAFALLENASLGINLSGLLNTFAVWSVRRDGKIQEIRRSLVDAVVRFYRPLGVRTAICLTTEEDLTDYCAAGFKKEKEYICFTSSRRAIKSYYDYVQERFSRFEERKQRASQELSF